VYANTVRLSSWTSPRRDRREQKVTYSFLLKKQFGAAIKFQTIETPPPTLFLKKNSDVFHILLFYPLFNFFPPKYICFFGITTQCINFFFSALSLVFLFLFTARVVFAVVCLAMSESIYFM
jgi:hypothetical protein